MSSYRGVCYSIIVKIYSTGTLFVSNMNNLCISEVRNQRTFINLFIVQYIHTYIVRIYAIILLKRKEPLHLPVLHVFTLDWQDD